SIASVTSGTGGTAVLNADGTVTFTPDADFNGVATFSYTVTDGNLVSNTATVTVNVAPVNDAPVAQNDAVTVSEDVPFSSSISLLANDSDVDGDSLSVVAGTFVTAQGGSIVIAADGSYTYTPPADFHGTDTVDYTVTDGSLTDTATLTLTVTPVNDAPVGAGASVTTAEDTPVSGQVTASDVDGDSLTFAKASDPSHGSVTVDNDGRWTYTPDPDYHGPDSFTVTVSDGQGGISSITVRITVTPVADVAVIGGADTGTVTEDADVDGSGKLNASGSLTISDADTGEAAFQTTVSAAPGTLGSLSLDASGAWSYSVANSAVQYLKAGETKLETFTVKALDGTEHQVQVTITGVNDAALISGSSRGSVQEDTTLTSAGRLLVSDADSGQATFVAQQGVAGSYGSFTIDAAGNWTYLLDNDARHVQRLTSSETVTERFVVRTLDGTEQVIEISVRGLDDAPPTPPQAPAPATPPASEPPAAPSSPSPAPAPAPIVASSPLQAPLADPRPTLSTLGSASDALDPMQRAALSDVYTSSTGFRVVVMEAPEPTLTLYRGMGDQYADAGAVTSFSIPYDAFVHTDPQARVVLSAMQANGERLPDWLVFNPLTGKFEVVAPDGFRGDVTIKVVARDSQGREVSTMFRISIGERQNSAGNGGRAGLSEQLRAAAKRSALAFGELPVGKPARSQVL
ncbi:Ig-like domain-containing protein, partial [Pseudomonas stutzeri]|nr:Ig-like domain-containing protein [Stutzerimonas stutzeri]